MVEPQLPPPPGQVVAEPAGMPPALELLGITKRFGQHLVLDEVSLSLASGEVLALLGENGAGKTTLMRIASGLEHREGGEIRVRGSRCALASPAEALGLGIAMVHQHFSLVGNLSVAENVVLGRRGRHLHRLSRRRVAAEVEAVAAEYSIEVDGRRRVDQLSIDAQAKVELVKSLYHGARILILDEPTSSLGPRQIEDLFLTVQQMAARGLAIVLVTHRLGEIKQVSDHVVVLRYGRVAEAGPTAAFTEAELARAMIGREFEPSRRSAVAEAVTGAASSVALGSSLGAAGHETTAGDHGPDAAPVIPAALPATGGGEVRLAVRGLEVGVGAARLLAGVSFEAVAGRVLGIIGVEGNGQTELLEVLAGLRRPSAGSVVLDGADVTGADPAELHRRKMVSISGDRHRWDIVPGLSVAENIALHAIASGRYRRRGIISWKQVQADALRLAKQFDVRPAGVDLRIEQLSGGNQQKAVIARAVAEHPRVLVLGQPTRGLDIGARQFVHDQVIAARAAQTAIVLLSFDLDELFELSDDVIVLFRGAISYSSPRATASAAAVGAAMTGVEPEPATALAERAGAGRPGGGSRP